MTAAQGIRMQSKQVARSRPRQSKYKNTKIEVDGMKFDSKKEYQRYQQLCLMQRAGLIENLQCQVAFVLAESVKFSGEQRKKPAMRYIADFTYTDSKTGELVVEDVKSALTRSLDVYRMKKHLMLSVLGIEIREV